MQKIFSLFLIVLMTTLPVLSASASLEFCQNSHPDSLNNVMMMEQMTDSSATHDCCLGLDASCDCDNGQTVSSVLSTLENTISGHQLVSHNAIIPSLFTSKIAESLYRPPITIL